MTNNSIEDLVGNEGNEYPVADPSTMLIRGFRKGNQRGTHGGV
jgi:hypothetical protein